MVNKEGLNDKLKAAEARESEVESKREVIEKRKSRAKTAGKAAYGVVKTAMHVATGAFLEAGSDIVQTAHSIYRDSKNREEEVYKKAKFVSKTRIDAVDEFMKENMAPETREALAGFILEKWGSDKKIQGLAEKIERGEGIPFADLEKALKAKDSRAYDQLQSEIGKAIEKMPPAKQAELNKAIAGDDKTKVTVSVSAMISAFGGENQKSSSTPKKPPPKKELTTKPEPSQKR